MLVPALEPFVRQRTVLLSTYRRDGAPVGTPVGTPVHIELTQAECLTSSHRYRSRGSASPHSLGSPYPGARAQVAREPFGC
jgi:hypothetical protein